MPREYQAELISAKVMPVAHPFGGGIEIKDGETTPFIVERNWAAPAGHYIEEWSIRDGAKVLHRSGSRSIFIRGLQSSTVHRDEVAEPLALPVGDFQLVLVVEGRFMGSVEVTSAPAGA
ncbi:MAG TPA: hypothetical protein VI541_04075 [Actinomycetota bacterium]|nr:hypothetical protein [Actinomycetota bacterium]